MPFSILDSLKDQLDDTDMIILKELAKNARISLVNISKVVGLSRVAVKSRIDAMEKRGIIEQYTVIISPEKIGRTITAYLDIQVSAGCLNKVCDILSKEDCIFKLYQMTGNSSLHVHGLFADSGDLEQFLRDVVYRLPGLIRVECNNIIARIKDQTELRL